MLSLAFGELLFYIVFSWYSFTKGDDGIQGLLPPLYFQDAGNYYYLTLAIVVVALLVMRRITESPFGYIMRTLRDNQRRAAFLGINVRLHMLMNFVIAGAFAGLAGALWGPFSRSVSPGLLGWQESGIAVFMTLIGGAGAFIGPIVGSVIYTMLQAVVKMYTVYWPLTIGTIILLIVLFTEHDMGIVFNHARKLTLMHRGEIVVQGTPEQVRANEIAQKVYLGEHHA